MTKKIMLIPAGLLAAALLLAGCKGAVSREIEGFDFGSKEPTETTTSETETEAATEESTSETTEEETTSAAPSGEGEEFSCKRFRAVCPPGWTNYVLMDFWDKEKQDEMTLQFYKGSWENDFDLYHLASVRMSCYAEDYSMLDSRDFYENVEDESVTDPLGHVWEGYSGDYGESRNFFLSSSFDHHVFIATGLLNGDKSSYALTDEDFLSILASMKPNDEEDPKETTEEETTECETETSEESSEVTETESASEESETESTASSNASEKPSAGTVEPKKKVHVEVEDVGTELELRFSALPTSTEDLQALIDEYGLEDAKMTAALFVTALHVYPEDASRAQEMMALLCDPDEARSVISFVSDQLRQKPYLADAYFDGADLQNDFTPDEPFEISVEDYTNRENNQFVYVSIDCDGDERDRTAALREQPDGSFLIVKCPALMLGLK